jgi:hypothetical protein
VDSIRCIIESAINGFDTNIAREWVAFVFVIVGGTVGLRSYLSSQRQRKLENSFRMIDLFYKTIDSKVISQWHEIFISSSELAGAPYGHFMDSENATRPLSDLFSEGPPDNGAIVRIAQQFNLISHEIMDGTVNTRIVYFEFGQLMETVHEWLMAVDKEHKGSSFMKSYFSDFDRMFKKNKSNFSKCPKKMSYVE